MALKTYYTGTNLSGDLSDQYIEKKIDIFNPLTGSHESNSIPCN
jgi:hypothetical protein